MDCEKRATWPVFRQALKTTHEIANQKRLIRLKIKCIKQVQSVSKCVFLFRRVRATCRSDLSQRYLKCRPDGRHRSIHAFAETPIKEGNHSLLGAEPSEWVSKKQQKSRFWG